MKYLNRAFCMKSNEVRELSIHDLKKEFEGVTIRLEAAMLSLLGSM